MRGYQGEKLMVVISAMGKTTNALEKVVGSFYEGKKEESLSLFAQVKQQHLTIAKYLLVTQYLACEKRLKDIFTEAEWLLHDKPARSYDYYYDQVVCTGELMSTCVISYYLNESGLANEWVDVRDIIRTNDHFRDAEIDWQFTSSRTMDSILPLFAKRNIVITQGFVGATDENESTTLGREGSDYTAAVFANLLDCEELVIWKDVECVMNADPRKFPEAVPIPELNYREVIEMAYYGAQVIHPKTIKPLQNKNIPLYVKCFADPALPGTLIHNNKLTELPMIIVLKEEQVMIAASSTDYSFIGEKHVADIYKLFGEIHIRPNLTQNTAISFIAVLDDHPERIEAFASAAAAFAEVTIRKGLSLFTFRHFTKEITEKYLDGRTVLLSQETSSTLQVLVE
jgi:aspartate kinase